MARSMCKIAKHRDCLKTRMDPDKVLDWLLTKTILSNEQVEEVKCQSTISRRNEKLLDYVVEINDEEEFINALRDTDQKHLANYLLNDGVRNQHISEDWPLEETQIKIIDVNRGFFKDMIDMGSGLVDNLLARRVINERQREVICSKALDLDKIDAFLDILRRGSNDDYANAIQCLHDSNQSHIAEILEKVGEGHCRRIRCKYNTVVSNLTCVRDIAAMLFEKEMLSERERDDIFSLDPSPTRATEELLNVIMKKDKEVYDGFLKALLDTKQHHIHSLLTSEVYECSTIHSSIIRRNYTRLVEILDSSNGLVENLFANDVMSPREKEDINTEMDMFKKNDKLLSLISRKCCDHFNTFLQALIDTNQMHIYLELQPSPTPQSGLPATRTRSADTSGASSHPPQRTVSVPGPAISPTPPRPPRPKPRQRSIGQIRTVTKTDLCTGKVSIEQFAGNKNIRFEYKENPPLPKNIETDGQSRLAILENELYVVPLKGHEIEVYDLSTLNIRKRLSLDDDVENVDDIASCDQSKCLYVINWIREKKLEEILKVNRDGTVLKRWMTSEDQGRLSITHDENVVLTVYTKNKLNVYSPEGQLQLVISLPSNINHPQHAKKLINGNYVVSYGSGFHSDAVHGVCIVDVRGNILKSFCSEVGSSVVSLNHPMYLAIDRRGNILVADLNNSRVLLLSSTLEFQREVVTEKHGLRHPRRICLDDSNGRLIVACDSCKPYETDSGVGQTLVSGVGQVLLYDVVGT